MERVEESSLHKDKTQRQEKLLVAEEQNEGPDTTNEFGNRPG